MPLTCAITGHRPTRFKWKYDENNNGCKRLKKRMRDQFILLYEKGYGSFGSAVPWDKNAGWWNPFSSKIRRDAFHLSPG